MSDLKSIDDFKFEFDPNFDIFGDPTSDGGEDMYTDMDSVPGADPGVFLPNTEGRTEFLPPDPDRVPTIDHALKQDTPEYAARPAIERTKELFAYMYPHRVVLLGILEAVKEPTKNSEVRERVDAIREHKFSVYTPANLCTMLETAGAIECVTEDGAPYVRTEPKPDIVVEDGEEFYVPTTPPEIHWHITEAGAQMLDEHDPEANLKSQLELDKEFLGIYKRVMRMAATEEGTTMPELSAAVDKDPLISKPQRRFFVQHFVEALERCEAIKWNGSTWRLTDLGLKVYEEDFADVEETTYQPEGTDGQGVSTETQGVSW